MAQFKITMTSYKDGVKGAAQTKTLERKDEDDVIANLTIGMPAEFVKNFTVDKENKIASFDFKAFHAVAAWEQI